MRTASIHIDRSASNGLQVHGFPCASPWLSFSRLLSRPRHRLQRLHRRPCQRQLQLLRRLPSQRRHYSCTDARANTGSNSCPNPGTYTSCADTVSDSCASTLSQSLCPASFSNKRAFKQAFPEFYNRRILLVLYLVKLSASSPITTFPKPNLLGFTKCNCYFDNPFNISTSSITCMPASS